MDNLLIDKKKLRRGLKARGFTKIQKGEGFSPAEMKKLMKRKDIKMLYELWGKSQGKPAMMGNGASDDAKKFFSKLWKNVKKTSGDVNAWLKKNKVISKTGTVVATVAPLVGTLAGQPALGKMVGATTAGLVPVVSSLGYGKRRVRGNGTGALQGSSIYGAVSSAGGGKIRGSGTSSTSYGMISSGAGRIRI